MEQIFKKEKRQTGKEEKVLALRVRLQTRRQQWQI